MGQTKKRSYDRYTLAYKLQAVKLANHPEVRSKDVAESLRLHPVMLYRWQMEYRKGQLRENKHMKPQKASPKRRPDRADPTQEMKDKLTAAEKRIKQLERELDNRNDELDLLKKGRTILRQDKVKIFELIEKNRDSRNVRKMCSLYGVSPSGYYAWRDRPESARRRHDRILMDAIGELHQGLRKAYGAPRLHRLLRQKDLKCSVRRVNRLMREVGIKASSTGLYAWRPGQHEFYSSTGNRLAKEPVANEKGVQ